MISGQVGGGPDKVGGSVDNLNEFRIELELTFKFVNLGSMFSVRAQTPSSG
jgi:hypothetical protein